MATSIGAPGRGMANADNWPVRSFIWFVRSLTFAVNASLSFVRATTSAWAWVRAPDVSAAGAPAPAAVAALFRF